MANNYHGKTILGELMDGVSVPQNTSADSTAALYVGKETGGNLWLEVYACTGFTISDTKAISFFLQSDDAGTLGDCEAPITTSNAGGKVGATGTNEHDATHIAADGATYGCYVLATTGDVTWVAGDLLCEIAIPETMMRLAGHTYVNLKVISTDADVSGTLDAFVVARI